MSKHVEITEELRTENNELRVAVSEKYKAHTEASKKANGIRIALDTTADETARELLKNDLSEATKLVDTTFLEHKVSQADYEKHNQKFGANTSL